MIVFRLPLTVEVVTIGAANVIFVASDPEKLEAALNELAKRIWLLRSADKLEELDSPAAGVICVVMAPFTVLELVRFDDTPIFVISDAVRVEVDVNPLSILI